MNRDASDSRNSPFRTGLVSRWAWPRRPGREAQEPARYTVRFLQADRRAEPTLTPQDLRDALEVMLAYKRIAPGIVVERNGVPVAETRNGALVHPVLDGLTEQALEQEHPPEISYSRAVQLLGAYRLAAELLETAHPLEAPLLFKRLQALEATLLAHAARDGLDLLVQGFVSAQALIAQYRQARLSRPRLPTCSWPPVAPAYSAAPGRSG